MGEHTPEIGVPASMEDVDRRARALHPHYSRFRVADRLLMTGHSHQAWPDVAREGLLEAFDVAAERVCLMPQGRSAEELARTAAWLEPECQRLGVHFAPRHHVAWFGHVRGT